MKTKMGGRLEIAMTLVELLTVIAMIAVLAGMLLPALVGAKTRAKVASARNDISQLNTAISSYKNSYNQYPAGPNAYGRNNPVVRGGADASVLCPSFTFGTMNSQAKGFVNSSGASIPILNPNPTASPATGYQANNSEVVAILKGWLNFPGGGVTVNTNYALNPHKDDYLAGAKLSGDQSSQGIGTDGVFRDPWKNPYIISLDLTFSGYTRDPFYRVRLVSQQTAGSPAGFNGLINNTDVGGNGTNYDFMGGIMIWSAGPDGMVNPSVAATINENKDNVLSWK